MDKTILVNGDWYRIDGVWHTIHLIKGKVYIDAQLPVNYHDYATVKDVMFHKEPLTEEEIIKRYNGED